MSGNIIVAKLSGSGLTMLINHDGLSSSSLAIKEHNIDVYILFIQMTTIRITASTCLCIILRWSKQKKHTQEQVLRAAGADFIPSQQIRHFLYTKHIEHYNQTDN